MEHGSSRQLSQVNFSFGLAIPLPSLTVPGSQFSLNVFLCVLQDNYFPEIPPFEKKVDLFYTAGYRVSFPAPVPCNVLRQMLFYCGKLRKWNVAWKSGFLVQAGNVEVLVELKPQERGGNLDCALNISERLSF